MGNDTTLSVAVEAATPATPAGKTRITDIVGDNYKTWERGTRVIFDAGTNSGKTYFVLNVLLPWALKKHRQILYLCNRSPLREQVRDDVFKLGMTETLVTYEDGFDEIVLENRYEHTIRVENYQWMEAFVTGNPAGAADYFRRFYYVVADEYHYQLNDPSINKGIDVSYKLLNEWTETKAVIFMSATAHPFFDHWKKTGEINEENYYYLPPDYSFVDKICFFWTDNEELAVIRQEAQRGKVLVFVDAVKHMRKLKDILETDFPNEVATACSAYRPEASEFDGLSAVLQNETLCKRITIVTTVFYNGINIKDPELKCIISRLWDATVNAQILGRKRPLNAADTCTVYFRGYSHAWIKQERERIRKCQLEPVKMWNMQYTGQQEEWERYLHTAGIVELLDTKCKTLYRDKYGAGWVWHRRAVLQYETQMNTLKQMMDSGYQWALLKEISEPLVQKMEPLKFKGLEDYINANLGKEMLSDVMRKDLVELGHIDNPANRHKNKNGVGLSTINRRLKECYNAKVVSIQKRVNQQDRTMYWTLERL